jgi:hypothetical protein
VGSEERDEEQAEQDVEVEEGPDAEREGRADGPRDTRRRGGQSDGREPEREWCRAVPRPPVAKPTHDPTELEREQWRNREADDGVEPEEDGVGGMADPDARDASRGGQADQREQRPVDEAGWWARRPIPFGIVR